MYLIDPPRPLRIAMISAHTSPLDRLGGHKAGGLNVYVRETATELGRMGHLVDVFTRDDGAHDEIVEFAPGVRVVHLSAGPRDALDKDGLWEHLPAFLHSLRSFKERQGVHYDIVHSHYWMSGWVGSYLGRLWDVPHVTMFHTLGEAKNRARADEHEPPHRIQAERRVVATTEMVVAASEHERGLLERLYDADPDRVEVIPCGVNPAMFQGLDRSECRERLGLGPEPVVLFVGRLEPLKGVDLLVDALEELPGVRLVIVGGDEHAAEYVNQIRRQACRLGVGERVQFAGSVPQADLPLYYGAADVCAIPSFYESFGLVALEAMACGTPVVASRVGGLTGTVRDGENGFLIPWRSPAVFAAKINAIITDPALRDRLGRVARTTAASYHWSGVSRSLDALYSRLIETRAASGCHAAGEPVAVLAEHALCHNG